MEGKRERTYRLGIVKLVGELKLEVQHLHSLRNLGNGVHL